jgi:hypothetical protein
MRSTIAFRKPIRYRLLDTVCLGLDVLRWKGRPLLVYPSVQMPAGGCHSVAGAPNIITSQR